MTNAKLTSLNSFMVEYCLYGFIIMYPFSVKWTNASILGLCLFGLLSSPVSFKMERLTERKSLLLFPLYFILLCIGVSYSSDVTNGLMYIERSISFFILPICFATGRRIPFVTLVRTGWIFTFTTVTASLFCIIQNILYFRNNEIPFGRFFDWEYSYIHLSGFIQLHPTYFSIIVLIAIYLLIYLPGQRRWTLMILRAVVIAFLFIFLIMLGTKIGILIFILFTNAAFIAYLRRKKMISLIFGYVLVNILMVGIAFRAHVIYWRFLMAYETFKNTLNGTEKSDYRIFHWKCASKAISQKPLFGWGTGDSHYPLNECYEGMGMNELVNYNAHNQFLETWIKIGLGGLLVTSLCLLYPLYKSIRNRHHLFISIFATYLVIAFTESIFSVQKGIALFSLIASIYLGHIYVSRPKALHQTEFPA